MSQPTKTLLGAKARKAVYAGVNSISVPVSMSYGPQGKNALLFRTYNRGSRITNDGYTISECQESKDPFINLAAVTFKEACKRTNERVGDGTTTTAVIGGRLFNDCYKLLSENHSEFLPGMGVMTLKKRILESTAKVKEAIKVSATKVETLEDLEKIAIISVEDIELGKTIAAMAWQVGVDGFIDVVEGHKGEIETEVIEGFRFPAKVAAKVFVNNPARYEMLMEDCPVLLTNYAMDNIRDFIEPMKNIKGITGKLIIIAPSFSENVLLEFVAVQKANFVIHPVAVPSLRIDQFEDLAIYCDAKFIDKNKGKLLRNALSTDLGFIGKLIVKDTESREDAVATGGKGAFEVNTPVFDDIETDSEGKKKMIRDNFSSPVKDRIATLKGQLSETHQESFKKLMERRIASMASAVGVIRVGDSTQASSLYRKLKIEDAVYACKAALRGGFVKGGGLCLKEIAETLDDNDIIKNALLEPYRNIQASVEGGIEIGPDVIDPMEGVYYAVEHASGVISNLVTVEIITAEVEDTNPGDGYMAIARALNEFVITDKINKGQLRENEAEMFRDSMNGLTYEEKTSLDQG